MAVWPLRSPSLMQPRFGPPYLPRVRRLACRRHNFFHAEETYGRAFMAKYRRQPSGTQMSKFTVAGDSH
jgi:hypothetical protein